MGTWGTGWFENDAAADFLWDLEAEAPPGRRALLLGRLHAVADGTGYLEGSVADEALAVAALLAIAGGADPATVAPNVELPGALPGPDAEALALAREAVHRLAEAGNDWLGLWAEAGEQEQTLARLAVLQEQLRAVTPVAQPAKAAPLPTPGEAQRRRWWPRRA